MFRKLQPQKLFFLKRESFHNKNELKISLKKIEKFFRKIHSEKNIAEKGLFSALKRLRMTGKMP